jgi:hypothetical protein
MAATLAFVIVFNFFLFRVMGDPTSQLARLPQASPQEIEQLKHDYGLDKSLGGHADRDHHRNLDGGSGRDAARHPDR